MPSAADIKAAARRLPVADRADLLVDLAKDEAVRKEQIKRLRAMIEEGERDIAEGRYVEVNSAAEAKAFFEDIKRRGRARLKRSA